RSPGGSPGAPERAGAPALPKPGQPGAGDASAGPRPGGGQRSGKVQLPRGDLLPRDLPVLSRRERRAVGGAGGGGVSRRGPALRTGRATARGFGGVSEARQAEEGD